MPNQETSQPYVEFSGSTTPIASSFEALKAAVPEVTNLDDLAAIKAVHDHAWCICYNTFVTALRASPDVLASFTQSVERELNGG